jgi:hypothetical protein
VNQNSDTPEQGRVYRTPEAYSTRPDNQNTPLPPEPEYGAFWSWLSDVGVGWHPLLAEAHRRVSEVWPDYTIVQVKEKWGGLRIYLAATEGNEWRDVEPILADIEARSLLTCEHCGQPGVRRQVGWIKTMCDECSGGAAPSRLRSERMGNVTVHRMESE